MMNSSRNVLRRSYTTDKSYKFVIIFVAISNIDYRKKAIIIIITINCARREGGGGGIFALY